MEEEAAASSNQTAGEDCLVVGGCRPSIMTRAYRIFAGIP